ncbi:MAG: transposase zinc-binding domain-containing protein [Acidobacteria bacterium]|nr:transposase zinc-binding domain-containing protein [Acidobacteriota bacterium]
MLPCLRNRLGRLVCRGCGHEAILAFSCKTRLLCPSCAARQMSDAEAHLLDDVLPRGVPYRHLVVSLPFEIRGLLAFHPPVLNAAIRLINDSVLSWQKKRSHLGRRALAGGISVLQRAGGSLNVIGPQRYLA